MDTLLDPFYPIVPDLPWLERLLPLGVRTIQLRLKDASKPEIDRQVARSLMLCRRDGCQLIVNDHWEAAIRHGADFLHLGQEDLSEADLEAIRGAGIRLGLSTHDAAELETALAAGPDYVALGPVYETTLKAMQWAPQGLERVGQWAKAAPCPLVAIGGITLERADAVWGAGAGSIAVITDFLTHADPEARVRAWVAWAEGKRDAASSSARA